MFQGLHLVTENTPNGQKVQILLEELADVYGLEWTTTLLSVLCQLAYLLGLTWLLGTHPLWNRRKIGILAVTQTVSSHVHDGVEQMLNAPRPHPDPGRCNSVSGIHSHGDFG